MTEPTAEPIDPQRWWDRAFGGYAAEEKKSSFGYHVAGFIAECNLAQLKIRLVYIVAGYWYCICLIWSVAGGRGHIGRTSKKMASQSQETTIDAEMEWKTATLFETIKPTLLGYDSATSQNFNDPIGETDACNPFDAYVRKWIHGTWR